MVLLGFLPIIKPFGEIPKGEWSVCEVVYELIAVLIILNFVSEESIGVANSLTLLPTIAELNVAKLSSVKIVPYSVRYVMISS